MLPPFVLLPTRLRKRWLGLTLLLACGLAPLPAGQPARLEERLLADAADGSWQEFDLLEASLIAGGERDATRLAYRRRQLEAYTRLVLEGLSPAMPPARRAEEIRERMHRQLLVGRYDPEASDPGRALDAGDYNCLSALVLYHELCRHAALRLELWAQPGHVYCRLANQSERIEPTRSAGRLPAAPAAAGRGARERQLTPVELIGRCYYNRGVALLAQREFEAGTHHLEIACRLDPADRDARQNLLAGLNNWALALHEHGDRAQAAALVARGLALDPDYSPLRANQRLLQVE